MDGHPYIGIMIIAAITVIDFIVALAKASFRNVNETLMQDKAEDGDKEAKEGDEFLDREHDFYDAVWVFTIASWICDGIVYAIGPLRPMLASFRTLFAGPAGDVVTGGALIRAEIMAVILTVIVTAAVIILIVLLSHKIPDRLGKLRAESFFYGMLGFMKAFTAFFKPSSKLLEAGCHAGLKLAGIDTFREADNVTEDEIISIVNEGQEQGVLEAGEAEMISNIISFDEKQTRDIMTHRTKIVAVDSELSIEDAMKFMAGQSFSRFPLFSGDIDNIIGVIHLKDVVKCYSSGHHMRKKLADIARKPLFVPDTQDIDDLFKTMQSKNIHMAIVIDEYGQTAGIVAMEDILEEIVGNICDEFDKEEELISLISEDTYMCSGELSLEELEDTAGFECDEEAQGSFDTLNGLLISELDRIPGDGETAILELGGFLFEIMETSGKMIRRVRVRKLSEEELAEYRKAEGQEDPAGQQESES